MQDEKKRTPMTSFYNNSKIEYQKQLPMSLEWLKLIAK
jgi:hypothetical protein